MVRASLKNSYALVAVGVIISMISSAWADMSLTRIGEITRDPQSYHVHFVLLKGTIRGLEELPPYPCLPPGVSNEREREILLVQTWFCYGAYKFALEDATGSLPVEMAGACCIPELALHLTEGETVIVQGTIYWDHLYPGSASAVVSFISRVGT